MKRRPLIALVDYGMGNLRSVSKALERVGARVRVTDSAATVRSADALVVPGVGAFGQATERLRKAGLLRALESALAQNKPFFGICLGLQMLFERSEEDRGARGIGFFRGSVIRFRDAELRIPHMGWNTVRPMGSSPSPISHLAEDDYVYFVHSYFPKPRHSADVLATTSYGAPFCSAAGRGRVIATQFHPEKSGPVGLGILSNFVKAAA